ncbi:MAG: hypothetical protein HYZ18_00745 [Pseudogulbenkiania sp.]|nr:hypothetical protein [Pseudogulbenkiania sp.]
MDIFAIRHANLVALAARYPSRRDLAVAVDRDESQISRYLTHGGRIGHQFARHVEACLDLPAGWMDSSRTPQHIDPEPLRHSLQRFIDSGPDPRLADTIACLLSLLAETNKQ